MTNDPKTPPSPGDAILDGESVIWEDPTPTEDRVARVRLELARARQIIDECETSHPAPDPQATHGSIVTSASHSVGARWGPLELLEELGRGAFGEVYRARDPILDRDVALKLLRRGVDLNVDRFVDEGRRLARIRHPNIVAVYGADAHEEVAGIWMDLVEGQTLESYLGNQGTMSAREATLIGIDLCRAVAAVHEQQLLHRDIKTLNVMRENGGRIVLMDFGSATPSAHGLTNESGLIEGTPFYMAPELLTGSSPSTSSDLYAVGVLLYRLVTGRYPVEAETLTELLDRRRAGESRPLREVRSDLPASFIRIIEIATAFDPDQRYSGTADLERALLQSLSPTERVHPAVSDAKPRRFWHAPLTLSIAALLILTLLVTYTMWPRELVAKATLRVSGSSQPLGWNSRVDIGDNLILDIDISTSAYVYVVNEDDQAQVFALFPAAGLELQNPIPAGRHELPGRQWFNPSAPEPEASGQEPGGESRRPPLGSEAADELGTYVPVSYEVQAEGQVEKFLVVISDKPIDQLEKDIKRILASNDESGLQPESKDILRECVHAVGSDEANDVPRGTNIRMMRPEERAQGVVEYARYLRGEPRSRDGVHVFSFRLEKRGTENR